MRAEFFENEWSDPVHVEDGQFIAVHELTIVCDGSEVAVYTHKHMWYVKERNIYATRVVFTYVDENQRTLPDN